MARTVRGVAAETSTSSWRFRGETRLSPRAGGGLSRVAIWVLLRAAAAGDPGARCETVTDNFAAHQRPKVRWSPRKSTDRGTFSGPHTVDALERKLTDTWTRPHRGA